LLRTCFMRHVCKKKMCCSQLHAQAMICKTIVTGALQLGDSC
jgi:hypothetical protein